MQIHIFDIYPSQGHFFSGCYNLCVVPIRKSSQPRIAYLGPSPFRDTNQEITVGRLPCALVPDVVCVFKTRNISGIKGKNIK
jgi:hypothetical protein